MTVTPPPGTRSLDGQFVWTGSQWTAAEVRSPDGHYRWDGQEWVLIWPPPAAAGVPFSRGELSALPIAVVIVVIAYIAYHAHRYSGCTFPPGVFEWPTACL